MKKQNAVLALFASVCAFTTQPVVAAWPHDKPIVLVVPYGAGGSSDLVGRAIAEQLQKQLGTTVVVENKPGAGGTLAASQLAKAPSDGYRLMLSNTAHTAAPGIFNNLDYDFNKGITHIARFAAVPNIILLNKDSKVNDMKGFLEYLKTEDTKVNYGTPGIGTTNHLAVALLNSFLGTNPSHVPYGGAGPVVIDLIAGRLDFTVQSTPIASAHIAAKSVKAIGVTSRERIRQFPDIPTVAEVLGKDYEIVTWYGLDGPPGLPENIQMGISDAVKRALSDPKFVGMLESIGADAQHMNPKEYSAFVDAESKKWLALNLKKE